MVGLAPGLAATIVRPPTPPKESTTKLSDDNLSGFTLNALNRPLLDTPEESPASSADYFKSSSEKVRKKVGFSGWTEYHKPPSACSKDSDSEGQIRRLPPSRDCKSSTKSILKNCTDNAMVPSVNELLAFDQSSLPVMLRSTTLHLASASRTSRLDAYSTLLACLSAYDDIPNIQELSEKVVEFTSNIRRDVAAKITEDGTVDIQLATQALKVLTVFVCTPSIAKLLPEDFCLFILERSISSIEDAASPKILVSHYMHLIEKQKFGSKQMTTDRVNRLLTALDGITNRIKGNRVVGHRLMIYHRLLTQAKPVMISRVGSWIDHLVAGMLSTIKDIRARAITFGMDAGLHLGATAPVTQACLEVFNRASPEGKKVVDFLSSRLADMSKSKDDGVHVPQIWSVVVLFLRSRRRQLECWEHIKIWLGVIQRCFNSSDAQIKFQASIAWNRFIFAINLDTSTCDSMVRMLRQPIVSSLERKDSDKTSKQTKQIARSSYCTLLYYAFRPTATHAQLDRYWDLYVSQTLSSCFIASKAEANYACEVLTALFAGNGKSKIWDEDKANANGPVKPEELPCLDSKWVRLRTPLVLQIFDKMFDIADWSTGKDQEGPMMLAWRSFMTALGNAGSKEVKVSMDSMIAISHIINGLKQLLDRDTSTERRRQQNEATDPVEQPDLFEKIHFLVVEAVAKLGTIAFMERRIILTSQNSFEAAETPSSRSSRDLGSPDSPASHLLSLLLTKSQDDQIPDSLATTIQMVMHIPIQSATLRRTRLATLRNQARLLSVDSTFSKKTCRTFWKLLTEATFSAMKLPQQIDLHSASPQYPGHEYREAMKILELGIQQDLIDVTAWHDLHRTILDAVRKEVGNEAVILIMTEPLASTMYNEVRSCNETFLDSAVSIGVSIVETVHWPQSGHLMERAQKLLWGVVHASSKGSSLDPYNNIYLLVDALFSKTYGSFKTLSTTGVSRLLSAVTNMINVCPPALQRNLISRIQHGLSTWIEDAQKIIGVASGTDVDGLSPKFKKLWSSIKIIMENLPDFSSSSLSRYQGLILSGLRSRHKSIVNDSISMWNCTFGFADTLEYPKDLHLTLSKLKRLAELNLPDFPETEGDEVLSSPMRFVESEEDEEGQPQSLPAALQKPTSTKVPSLVGNQPMKVLALSPSPNTSNARESSQSARRSVKTTPKARLRHNDSQIQFAAVESSPLLPEAIESQYLTDRQKEVKERQGREAAAMFPEISSSPRSASRPAEYSLPKLVLKSTKDEALTRSMNDESSPIFPPDVLMNDFLGSSPTPSSSKKGSNGQRSDDEPPSSPPAIPPKFELNKPINLPMVDEDNKDTVIAGSYISSTATRNDVLPVTKDSPSNASERAVMKEVTNLLNGQAEGVIPKAIDVQADERILSDFDVFVDASAEPMVDQPTNENSKSQVSRIMSSFQSDVSSHFSTEDDQVTAQLVGEMEQASSQHTSNPLPRTGRKRRSIFDHRPSSAKKIRRSTQSPAQQHVESTTKAGVLVADCVMIDARAAAGEHVVNSQEIKRERSPSPSIITATQFENEMSTTRKRAGRTRRTSRASLRGQEASSVRRSPRQIQVKVEQNVDDKGTPALPSKARKSSRLSESFVNNPITSTSGSHTEVVHGMAEAPGNAAKKPPNRSLSGKSRQQRSHDASRDYDSSLDTDPLAPLADGDNAELAVDVQQAASANDEQQRKRLQLQQKDRVALANCDTNGHLSRAGAVSEPRDEVPTAQGILQGFKDMLQSLKRVSLGPEDERAVVGLLFESVREVHEAGRRNTGI
ncbi:hypothetical protein N7G274_007122 [Stereocaulon virgatum]|uniref:Telomere-associated protein Rif1 N-terminal domain-containing protein n=1 Tax=Stereocaulon virgatum TaxID=373712 RepID=A0ABR4A624_9LECA